MPYLTVPEDTFERLAAKAAALNVSVDDLVKPALDQLAESDTATTELPLAGDAWHCRARCMEARRRDRAGRYPQGFILDDSREPCTASGKPPNFDPPRHEHPPAVRQGRRHSLRHRGHSDQRVARQRRGTLRRPDAVADSAPSLLGGIAA